MAEENKKLFVSITGEWAMEKVKRAKHLIDELRTEVADYFLANPYKISTKKDPLNGRLIYYIQEIEDLPLEIKTITGDIIQNLRSSLDHLAYSLFIKGGGLPKDSRHVYFPITESEVKFNDHDTQKKMAGLSQPAINIIIAARPYKEGNRKLWQLHELNNIDKHRLRLTAGSSFGSVDISAHIIESLPPNMSSLKKFSMPSLFLKPADNLFPLKKGDVLFSDIPEAAPNPKMIFNIQLVLNEPGIAEGEVLVPFLEEITSEVEATLDNFKSLV